MANNFVDNQGPENQGYGPAQFGGPTQPTTQLTGGWPAHVPVLQINTHGELEDVNTGYMVPERESVTTLTRVMSPNDPANMMLEANQAVLLGLQCQCLVCNQMSPDPSLCANCGVFGHAICIGVEHFQGYAFCRGCMGMATAQLLQ